MDAEAASELIAAVRANTAELAASAGQLAATGIDAGARAAGAPAAWAAPGGQGTEVVA
jgi:hypothetical protein